MRIRAMRSAGRAAKALGEAAPAVPVAPVNIALPAVTGTRAVGQTLTATSGSWDGTGPITFAYQWLRGGAAIAGATVAPYDQVAADAGAVLSCRVTATNAVGTANAVSTGGSATIWPPANTVLPAVSGTPTQGQTLTCSTGTWTGAATIAFAYQWRRDGVDIAGATASTYLLVAGDVGAGMACRVTGTNGDGASSALSVAVGPVAAQPAYLVPLHGRGVSLGDSITSISSSKPTRNYSEWMYQSLEARVRRAIGGDQGVGGNTLAQMLARISYTTSQKPDFVTFLGGHNTAMSAAPSTAFMTDWNAVYTALRAALPNALLLLFQTLPSTVVGKTRADYAAAGGVWDQQLALDGADGGKTRVVPVPASYDPTIGVHTYDGIHPNEAGARLVGNAGVVVLSPLIEPATIDQILGQTAANGTYGFGANLDADWALAGTTGTKAGATAPTGSVATGKALTNNTSASVVASKEAASGFEKQVITVSGTVSAEATVVFDDTANIALTGSQPGSYWEILHGVEFDGGSGLWHLGTQASSLGDALAIGSDTVTNGAIAGAYSGVMRSRPKALQSPNASIKPALQMRSEAGSVNFVVKASRPILRQIELAPYALPFLMDADGIIAPANKLAVTGTVTIGSTLTCNPGTWSGGGLAFNYQWQRAGVDIAGATARTYVIQAADQGSTLRCVVTPANTFGATGANSAATAAVP